MWGLLGLFRRDIPVLLSMRQMWQRLKALVRRVSLLVCHQLHHLGAPICHIYCSNIPKCNNHAYAKHAERMIDNAEHRKHLQHLDLKTSSSTGASKYPANKLGGELVTTRPIESLRGVLWAQPGARPFQSVDSSWTKTGAKVMKMLDWNDDINLSFSLRSDTSSSTHFSSLADEAGRHVYPVESGFIITIFRCYLFWKLLNVLSGRIKTEMYFDDAQIKVECW